MSVTQPTTGVAASLILRGRWSATVDEVDDDSSTVRGSSGNLRGLIQALRDQQGRRPASEPFNVVRDLDSDIANRLLRALEHQVGNGWLSCPCTLTIDVGDCGQEGHVYPTLPQKKSGKHIFLAIIA